MKKFLVATTALVMGCTQLFCATADKPTPYQKNYGRILTQLYDSYKKRPVLQKRPTIIPESIHFIWLGGTIPSRVQANIDSWKQLHPTWKVKVWTQADLECFKFRNKKAFLAAKSPADKKAVWSFEILSKEGGVYVDTSLECLRSFAMIHKSCEFYASKQHSNGIHFLSNKLFASAPQHPIVDKCVCSLPQTQNRHADGDFFTATFIPCARAHSGKVAPFPVPFLAQNRHEVTPETYAVVNEAGK